MNEREIVRRLQAYHQGKPLPRGETKRLYLPEDPEVLIVAFVRMGGESRPWGIAYGHPGEKPKLLTVAEARNRDLVAAMAHEFAPVLLEHLRSPGYVADPPEDPKNLPPLRQVWLPNPTHLDMLHHLAFVYTFTKWGEELRDRLNALGRACGWLFREAQRPGDQAVVVATTALRQAFTFPAEDVRQAHLGFLLAWLGAKGKWGMRLDAAYDAERLTVATSLDPELERTRLGPPVEAWGESRRAKDKVGMGRADRAVRKVLGSELERRWHLSEEAFRLLSSDRRRVNAGVAQLVTDTTVEQWYQYTRLELRINSDADGPAFFPSVETDRNAAAAASRYFVHNASAQQLEGLLVHDDTELLAEAVASGDAVKGEIIDVWDEAPERPGKGKTATKPVWLVRDQADRQLRLRTGAQVCVVGVRSRTGHIRSFEETDDGALDVEITIENWKTRRPDLPSPQGLAPNDPDLVGHEVAFVGTTYEGLSRTKSFNVWKRDGPGSWLTHSTPGGLGARPGVDDEDDIAAVARAEAEEAI